MMQAAAEAINGQRTAMHKAPRKGQLTKLAQKGASLSIVGYEEGGFAIVTADDVLPATATSRTTLTTCPKGSAGGSMP